MYTIEKIAAALNTSSKLYDPNTEIIQLLTDSRRLIFPETTLFFALVTQQRDGHIFINELYERGLKNFVVQKQFSTSSFEDANFIFADDTLIALQQIAAHHRSQFSYPVIAITGSNGKTIVKEWLYQLLSPDYNIVRSPRSYNSQIGVPLSVWQMTEENNLAIIEAGISKPGEMQHLQQIIQPTIGVFTNIGNAHDENFSSTQQKITEKSLLFKNCETVITNGDDELFTSTLQQQTPANLFTWGVNLNNKIIVLQSIKNNSSTNIQIKYKDQPSEITIPFTDEASIQNACTCICVLLFFKIDVAIIKERISSLQPIDMRLQLTPAINNCALINDSYSFDIASFSVALDFMQQQNQFTKKTVILSDVPGANSQGVYAEIIFMLKAKSVEKAIVIGEQWNSYYPFLQDAVKQVQHYITTELFLLQGSTSQFRDELILLKGARKFSFENIAALLQQKVHQTIMEINLTAMVHNLNEYRRILNPGVKIMAMVKASGYGSGSTEIANLLQFHKADYLAVAYADEGVELRKTNIRLPIMIMNIDEDAFESVIQYNLEPEIYSLSILKSFDAFLDKQALQQFPAHIKIDTGMHRLGFDLSEVDELINFLKVNNRMAIKSVFSHLASGEDSGDDAFTTSQAEKLSIACSKIKQELGYSFIKHISNSAATIRKPELQFDMVRLGIGLYGIDSSHSHALNLKPVASLKTTVAQIKKLRAGDTVGYNRKGKINTDSTIATLRIGYADGLRRCLSNGNGKIFIKGKYAKVIGSIAMDMTMVDITNINNIDEGDEVEIFGPNIPVEEVAASCNTIPYEILTGISQRVKRIYIEE